MIDAKTAKQMREDAIKEMVENLADVIGQRIEESAKRGDSRIIVRADEINKIATTDRFVTYLEEAGYSVKIDSAYIAIEW